MSDRTYLIGLPVSVTVTDQGEVTYTVHKEEASIALVDSFYEGDADDGLTIEQVIEDSRAVSADYEKHREEW